MPRLPGSALEAGHNLRKNAQAIDFGQLFGQSVRSGISGLDVVPQVAMARSALPVAVDFVRGLAGAMPTMAAAVAEPAKKQAAAPKAQPKKRAGGQSPALRMPARSVASPFEAMVSQVAAANGGGISINQLMALSEVASRVTPAPAKQPTAKDIGMQEYLNAATMISNKELADARAAGDQEAYASAAQAALLRLAPFVGADQYAIPQMPIDGE